MSNVETMASAPWQGLGGEIEHSWSPEQMQAASKTDWTVSKRRLLTARSSGIDLDHLSSIDELMGVDDYFVLVRDSDNEIFGPAGKDYIVTQNTKAFDFFKKFCEAGQMRMETAGALQGGRQVWALAKITRQLFNLPGGDEVGGYLLFSLPHIWGKALVVKFTVIRVICKNTFMMAMSDTSMGKGFRMPHIREFDVEAAKEAEVTLGISQELFEGFEATANLLAKTGASHDVVVRYVADVLQPDLILQHFGKGFYRQNSEAKQAELLMDPSSPKVDAGQFGRSAGEVLSAVNRQPGADLESAKGTLWGGFNAFTYYVDHLSGRDRDNALTSAWFGQKGTLKTKALKRAVQMAEVAR